MKSQKGSNAYCPIGNKAWTEHAVSFSMGQEPSILLRKGLSKELLNIPISLSLLHEREYNNVVRHLHHEKRRSFSEKNKSNVIVSGSCPVENGAAWSVLASLGQRVRRTEVA